VPVRGTTRRAGFGDLGWLGTASAASLIVGTNQIAWPTCDATVSRVPLAGRGIEL